MKSLFRNALLFLVSCAIALAGIEIGLRIWGPDVLAMGNQHVFYQYDPVIGWDNLPGAEGQFSRAEFSYRVKVNADGLWDADVRPRQVDEFRVVVLGDSFVWGIGAAYGERFTEVIEQRERTINVLNFGVTGFSPVQYLLQLDRVLSFKPDYVVLAFTLGNDPTENVSYSPYDHPKPYAELNADGKGYAIKGYPLLETKDTGTFLIGGSSFSRIIGMTDLVYYNMTKQRSRAGERVVEQALLYVPPEKANAANAKTTREVLQVNELILADLNKKVNAALGPGRFAVLLVPTKFELGQYMRYADSDRNHVGDQVKASLERLGIPAVDGRAVITDADFWRTDGHWRPRGHAKIGELTAKFLTQARADISAGRAPLAKPAN